MNPHRGDTLIQVNEQEQYILCFDLNACALIMDKFDMTGFEELADRAADGAGMSIKDVIYILWAGLQHHHPDLSEHDVGATAWAMDDMGSILSEAFQKALFRKTPPDMEKKVTRRKKTGTGKRPKPARTKQESPAQTNSGN